ncbi:DUF1735 domain-containing protein [Pedobacter aquae]|uniref:DUF1735 domain-containing protein n=1 Tax=Pedobacter aquae TaxID=2605747 RepID=A0A5C0VEC9_9SPHI|nr:DUF5627 domain-containing protein [Pedobacter aquae]QEK50429.1 DUF1735 domain-containing protein [Pedobacter aquae]
MKKILNISIFLLAVLTSCKNGEWAFPDYKVQSVYFAYQTPIRTITLGEDIFDTTLDNEFKCQIMATTGGVYNNDDNINIDITVDNSLAQGLSFGSPIGGLIRAMPANYYSLSASNIVIPRGSLIGGVTVQLTDAFFADPLSARTTYVIPVRMTGVQKADSILSSKNYTLYAIKYINPWTGVYLRRGKDVMVGKNGNTALTQTIVRRQQFVEKDQINSINTRGLKQAEFPVTYRGVGGANVTLNLLLTFDDNGNFTVSPGATGFTATGSGKFVKRGEKKSWGDKDRDALYLNYSIDATDFSVSTTDTLVLRDRGVAFQTFTTVN